MFSQDQVRKMVDTIVRTVQPLHVVVFGSYARGKTDNDSDIDFLVVERGSFGAKGGRWEEIKKLRKALRPFRGAKDILVYSADEAGRLRESPNHIVGEAFRSGVMAYEE